MCGHPARPRIGAGFTKEAEGVCLGLAPWTVSFHTSSGSTSDLFQDTGVWVGEDQLCTRSSTATTAAWSDFHVGVTLSPAETIKPQ